MVFFFLYSSPCFLCPCWNQHFVFYSMQKRWPHAVINCCYLNSLNMDHHLFTNSGRYRSSNFRKVIRHLVKQYHHISICSHSVHTNSNITFLRLFTLSTHKLRHHIPPSVHTQYTQAVSSHSSICSPSAHKSSIITFLHLFTLSTQSSIITFLHLFTLSTQKHRRYSNWNSTLNYLRFAIRLLDGTILQSA